MFYHEFMLRYKKIFLLIRNKECSNKLLLQNFFLHRAKIGLLLLLMLHHLQCFYTHQ